MSGEERPEYIPKECIGQNHMFKPESWLNQKKWLTFIKDAENI
jgi:hypothetical protein